MAARESFEMRTGRQDPGDAGGGGASSGEIREGIRRTRAEMDETVDALSEKLRPRHILDDVLEMFRGKVGGDDDEAIKQKAKDYGTAALGKLKSNPIPAALIGAGVAWLIFDQTRDGRSSSDGGNGPWGRWRDGELREYSGSFVDARTGEPYDESYGAQFRRGTGGHAPGGTTGQFPAGAAGGTSGMSTGGTSDADDTASAGGPGVMDKLKDKASQVAGSISGAASAAGESARGALSGTASSASDYGHRMAEWSGSAYQGAAGGARRGYEATRHGLEDALDRYPLAMGAAAMAAGVLVGLFLPETRRENELMGEQAARLKEGVKEGGRELLERGKEVATATAGAAADEARQQGLEPGSLAESVRNVARDVAGAARESARREGLTDVGQKAAQVAQRAKDTAKQEAGDNANDMRH